MPSPPWLYVLLLAALCGCAPKTEGPGATSGLLPAVPVARRSAVLHEAQFARDPGLRAAIPGPAVVDHLEASGLHPDDTAVAGIDRLPLKVQPQSWVTFELEAAHVARAQVLSPEGQVVALLQPGGGPQTVFLAAETAWLLLESDGQADSLLFLRSKAAPPRTLRPASAAPLTATVAITDSGAQTIASVATAVTAFLGSQTSGPGNVTVVNSYDEYTALYGAQVNPMSLALFQYFANGGKTAQIVPAASSSLADLSQGLQTLNATTVPYSFNLLVIPELSSLSEADGTNLMAQTLPVVEQAQAMVLIDPPQSASSPFLALSWIQANPQLRSARAAVYWPPLKVTAPDGTIVEVGCCPTMAGIYAANDAQGGVWQTPAGQSFPLVNVVELTYLLTDSDQLLLNPYGVNGIRDFRSVKLGIYCWGARTLSQDVSYKYVCVSRLMSYLTTSLELGLTWVAFEPINANLWAQIDTAITTFLQPLADSGGLFPPVPFTVQVDASNNPPLDRIEGLVNVAVQVAVVEPADYLAIPLTLSAQKSSL